MAKKTEENFEESYEKLETIVEKLNSDTVSLEESIKLYEEGIENLKKCEKILADAKQKIETIKRED